MFGIENSANNFGRSAGLLSNTIANRPNTAALGTLFVGSNNLVLYRYNGSTWDVIGGGGIAGATNGLQILGGPVGLGGVLTQNTQINCDGLHLIKFDNFTQFGIGNNVEPSMLFDTNNGQIATSYNGNQVGLFFDFLSLRYKFGDFNTNNLGTSLHIDDGSREIYTKVLGQFLGLKLDLRFRKSYLGDYNVNFNGYYLMIDDNVGTLNFNGANLESTTVGASSGKYLVIELNGNTYKIELKFP